MFFGVSCHSHTYPESCLPNHVIPWWLCCSLALETDLYCHPFTSTGESVFASEFRHQSQRGRIMCLACEYVTCGSFNVTAGRGHFGWAQRTQECCANGAWRVTGAEERTRWSPSVSPHGCSGWRLSSDFLLRVPLTYKESQLILACPVTAVKWRDLGFLEAGVMHEVTAQTHASTRVWCSHVILFIFDSLRHPRITCVVPLFYSVTT